MSQPTAISALEGRPLDWAVGFARCMEANNGKPVQARYMMNKALENGMASPSTNWTEAGAIIDKHLSFIEDKGNGRFCAGINLWTKKKSMYNGGWIHGYGSTYLIAAMRCYAMSVLGDSIELPDALDAELNNA